MLNDFAQKERKNVFPVIHFILNPKYWAKPTKGHFSIYSVSLSPCPKGNISAAFLNDDKYTKPEYPRDAIILSKIFLTESPP